MSQDLRGEQKFPEEQGKGGGPGRRERLCRGPVVGKHQVKHGIEGAVGRGAEVQQPSG